MDQAGEVRAYLEWGAWQRGWSHETRQGYARRLRSYLAWADRHGLEVTAVGTQDVRAWLDTLHPSGAVHTHARAALIAYYDYLADQERAGHNPARRVPRPPTKRSVPRSLDPDGIRALIDAASGHGPWWHCYVGLLCYAGLRRVEACQLRWVDVEGDDAWLRVLGKGSITRVLPIHASLRALLQRHRQAHPHPVWMFPGQTGDRPISVSTATKRMRTILDEAGLPDAVPHQSRHSLAVDLLAQGWDLATVMEALGHQSLQSTTVYARARPERVAQAVASLEW